jgi:hypothetical protein
MNNKKEIVEQIYKLLMGLVDDESDNHEVADSAKPSGSKSNVRKNNNKTKVSQSKSKTQTTNKFDNMPERNMFKEDIQIDRKLRVVDPCPRTRSFNTIEVSCRVCGKKDSINPVLVHEPTRYKCNGCAKSGG